MPDRTDVRERIARAQHTEWPVDDYEDVPLDEIFPTPRPRYIFLATTYLGRADAALSTLTLSDHIAAIAGDAQSPPDEQMKALASCIALAEHHVDSWREYPESEAALSAARHLAGLKGIAKRTFGLSLADHIAAVEAAGLLVVSGDWAAENDG
jgi:hypothetical protein